MDDEGFSGIAQRVRLKQRLIYANTGAKNVLTITVIDAALTTIFAMQPDDREYDSERVRTVYTFQYLLALLSSIASLVLFVLVWSLYAVPQREITFERLSRLWYVITVKVMQIVADVALTGYPTALRQSFAIGNACFRLCEMIFVLRIVINASEPYSRREQAGRSRP